MAIIAGQHKNDVWRPLLGWPEDCLVQWGGRGLVLSKDGNHYQTAFFEAFPKDGSAGFIRGEGKGLEAAEAAAHKIWQRQNGCNTTGGHRWSRTLRNNSGGVQTYINGGCFCLKCGSFKSVMAPVVALGDWRKPLSVVEISAIASGHCRPSRRDDAESLAWSHKLSLRAKLSGIKLPPVTEREEGLRLFEEDSYELGCQRAVAEFYLANRERLESSPKGYGLVDLFDAIAVHQLKKIADEFLENQQADQPNCTGP
jgi:hypothetical protein